MEASAWDFVVRKTLPNSVPFIRFTLGSCSVERRPGGASFLDDWTTGFTGADSKGDIFASR